jgi:hypothetical protein
MRELAENAKAKMVVSPPEAGQPTRAIGASVERYIESDRTLQRADLFSRGWTIGLIKKYLRVPKVEHRHLRKLTWRSGGGSLQQLVGRLRSYVLGWKAYFGKTETPKVWRELDQWIRHRMRAIQLKQWRRGTTAYRELRAIGARQDVALMVAGNMRRLWHNSGTPLN